jgi:hypothetical protein
LRKAKIEEKAAAPPSSSHGLTQGRISSSRKMPFPIPAGLISGK